MAAGSAANKPATPNTATLEVSVEDAQKLAVAADLGKLSLALRKTGSVEIAPVRAIQVNDLGGGAPVGGLRGEVGGRGRRPGIARAVVVKPDEGHTMTIVNGDVIATVAVPREGGR